MMKTKHNALVDTGSDYSLVSEDILNDTQKSLVSSSNITACGASSEELQIEGEILMDVKLGKTIVRQHRFIVVSKLVTRVILGMDLWIKLGTVTLDLTKGRLRVDSINLSLPLNTGERTQSHKSCSDGVVKLIVRAENAVVIPPRTELFICCSADGMVPDERYLLCPRRPEGSPVAPPHCCIQGSIKKKMYVRVANVSDKHETVQSGEEIGELEPSVVGYDGNHSLLSSIEGKRGNFIVGESLTFEQKEEMDKVLHEFKNVFYNGGPLPLVQVGVEHTIRVNPDSAPIANRPRQLSLALEAEVKKELSKLQDMGVIKKSCSPWAAPIVCARRADGSLRLAIDYRGVNSVSQPATLHPIPVWSRIFLIDLVRQNTFQCLMQSLDTIRCLFGRRIVRSRPL
ncbi:uncharacterized protein LOC135209799 [Macrobrachium nipponense]|uniref:uncharacterized protein LOC135209799 n=1 Tax=Macrobrachium nipponense TaxID=159736 RepID=UPI0030C7C0FD